MTHTAAGKGGVYIVDEWPLDQTTAGAVQALGLRALPLLASRGGYAPGALDYPGAPANEPGVLILRKSSRDHTLWLVLSAAAAEVHVLTCGREDCCRRGHVLNGLHDRDWLLAAARQLWLRGGA